MKLRDKTILIVSNEPWGDIWYSKHNWAFELSKDNLVYFINPPKKWKFSHLFNRKPSISNYSENLKILNYYNNLPFTRFKMIFKINERIICKVINKAINNKENLIFWSFDPYRFSRPQLFNPIKSIYFRVDEYIVKREKTLVNNVDYVIVSSSELLQNISANKYLSLSHGISEDEFKLTEDVEYKEGYFLYVGNIDHRLDVNLIERMLVGFPNERFLFIGKKTKIDNDRFQDIFYKNKYPNIILHGVEHFKKLKNYIYKSKVCLVPMDLSVHGNAVHHHKSLQYLAMGKPVISPIFKDEINNEEFILGYKNFDEAIEKMKNIKLYLSKEKGTNRIAFAKQFLYSNLIKKIEEFID
jgi:hypothetical protein